MKTTMMRWFMVMSLLTLGIPRLSSAEEEAEELPKAEPYRQTIRHSFNRMGGYGGGGGGGGGGNLAASYDLSKTYDSMIRKTSADNRMGGDYKSSSSNRFDMGYSDDSLARDDYYDIYASESGHGGYGGYASESGYGYSLTKYVDCNSAIAILSLILFLDILRDIVEDLTQSGNMRRRRRSGNSSPSLYINPMEQFILDGGAGALVEGIPDIVVPLLHELNEAVRSENDVNHVGGYHSSGHSCVPVSLCRANWALADRYGGMGRVAGALLSNVVAKAFVGGEPWLLHQALEASRWGRRGTACHIAYPCDRDLKNSTSQKY